MRDIAKLKQTLRELVTDESMEAALAELEKHLPTDVPKFNPLLQLQARLNEINNQRIKNVVSNEQATLQYDKLRDDLLTFFSGLQESDFSVETAKKANMGGVLYRIPDRMQHLKKSKCIVRVAYDESLLKDTLDSKVDVVIEALKVSKNMEVKLVDEEGDGEYFEITSRSTPEQFLVQDEYTEWTFFVKPLELGTYPLALIISLVIYDDGKDRKKDITLERTISVITEAVPEEVGDHTLRKAGILFALTDKPDVTGGKKTGKKPPRKLLTGALVLAALAILMWLLWPTKGLDVFNLDGTADAMAAQEERDFQSALEQSSPALVVAFLAKYENSGFERQAREWVAKVAPNIDLDKAVKEHRLKENIIPIDRSRPDNKRRKEDEKLLFRQSDDPVSGNGPESLQSSTANDNPSDKNQLGLGAAADSTVVAKIELPTLASTREGGETVGGDKPNKPNDVDPSAADPSKPMKIRWDDKVTAKEDPLNWLPTTMVFVKGGKYKMGCNTKIETTGCAAFAEPSHEVKLGDFQISRFEVTQALWNSVMGERKNPSRFDDCDLCPVEKVSWNEAHEFIKKLNRKTGGNYRLPTEAEWEYASRQGGKDIRFGDGNNTAKTANFNFNSEDMPGRRFVEAGEFRQRTVDVFSLKPNAFGLFHMSGNVAEWCEDRWHTDYEGAPADGSAWLEGEDNRRVIRGGGWDTEPYASRTYDRDAKKESTADDEVGFRLAW